MKLVKEMPFYSVLDDNEFDCVLWQSQKQICEANDGSHGACDTSGFYYGTSDSREPKFCARHFYDVVSGDGNGDYGLKDKE